MGRSSSLTLEIQEAIVEAMRSGNYAKAACQQAGVSYNTYKTWMQRGDGAHARLPATPEYTAFADAVHKAEAECETNVVSWIFGKLKGDPALAMKFLSLRFPERWGARLPTKPGEEEEDWRQRAKKMVEAGELTYEDAETELGPDIAQELFSAIGAGVKVEVAPEENVSGE